MFITRNYHGCLQVPQGHHIVARGGTLCDVHYVVGNPLLVQRLVRGVALHAGRLHVYGNHRLQLPDGREAVCLASKYSSDQLLDPGFS